MPIMFCSAMPMFLARSGYFLAKLAVIVDFERSASTVTMRSFWAPRSRSASPNAARVALAGMTPPSLFLESAQLVDDRPDGAVLGQIIAPGRLGDAEDLADGGDGLGRLGRLAVPLGVVFHERDALALHRVGHDEEWLARGGLGLLQGLVDLGDAVTIDLDDRPAEGLPLGGERLQVTDLGHEVVELDPVVVEDDGEVVEGMAWLAQLRRGHGRLPHLALLDLAVAQDAVHARRRARVLEPQGRAGGDRQPLAERSRGGLDPRQRGAVGMPLERAAQLAQGDEQVLREVAGLGHSGVLRRHTMALGEDETVALGPVRPLGIVAHAAEVEGHDQVDDRERAARMPRARVREHADDLDPAVAGDLFETSDVCHQASSSMSPTISSTRTSRTAISGA